MPPEAETANYLMESIKRSLLPLLAWWRPGGQTRRGVGSRILSGTLALGLVSCLAKIFAMGRDTLVAKTLGVGDSMDAFAVALGLGTFAISLLMSSLNYALVPTLVGVRESDGRAGAQRLLSNALAIGLPVLLVVGVINAFAADTMIHILAPAFDPKKLALTSFLLCTLLPGIVASGFGSTCAAVLNSEKRFVLVGLVPAFTPFLAMVLLLAPGLTDPTNGVTRLAGATCMGLLCEAALVALLMRRLGYSLMPKWSGLDAATRTVFVQMSYRCLAALLMSAMALVEQATAARLGPGNVAMLSYSNKVLSALLGIAGVSLLTVTLPHFAELIAAGDWVAVRRTIRRYTWLIILGTLPLVAFLGFFSEPVVRLLFERGSFIYSATLMVSSMQSLYAL